MISYFYIQTIRKDAPHSVIISTKKNVLRLSLIFLNVHIHNIINRYFFIKPDLHYTIINFYYMILDFYFIKIYMYFQFPVFLTMSMTIHYVFIKITYQIREFI